MGENGVNLFICGEPARLLPHQDFLDLGTRKSKGRPAILAAPLHGSVSTRSLKSVVSLGPQWAHVTVASWTLVLLSRAVLMDTTRVKD